jgi:2-keto-4-pentenoate hydratase
LAPSTDDYTRDGALQVLSDEQVATAAELLLASREGRIELEQLPSEVTPQNTTDVQRIIDSVMPRVDLPIKGWKIYSVYRPMYPVFLAPIYHVLETGSEVPTEYASHKRLVEPEIMFRIDRDLPPRDEQYDPVEIIESVTPVVSFEILRSRFQSGDPHHEYIYSALADNISNGCVVIGDAVPNWRRIAFEDVKLRLFEGDKELISVVGCHPLDNPVLPIIASVNRLRRRDGVKAGHIMVSSSSTSFFSVAPRTPIRAVYAGLGEVTATFSAD